MDTLQFNRIFLCNVMWNPGASQWRRCGVKVPQRNPWARKHPLVCHGEGFWLTETYIVTGFLLKHRPEVYRPIFQFRRQRRLKKIHATILRHADVFIRRLRRNLTKRAMLGSSLPVDIISLIGSYVE